MSSLIRLLFADKLEEDIREPMITLSVGGGTFGVLPPSHSLWIQMSALLVLQSVLCNALAVLVYYFVIKRRGTATAFLVGYGCIIPFVMVMPNMFVGYLELKNACFMVCVASTPILLVFRCLEAMHGFSPAAVESQVTNYMIYYGSVIEFVFDDKTRHPVQSTTRESVTKAKRFLIFYFFLGILFSILLPTNFSPFAISRHGDFRRRLAHNFVMAYLTHVCIHVGTLGFGAAISLLAGIRTMDIANNPFFLSKSPSDFWGRRWNCLVHGALKRGVYKPIRRLTSSAVAATAATFVASGLLHEYVLWVITLNRDRDTEVQYGMHLAFFAYNAAVFVIELLIRDTKALECVRKSLHPTAVSLLVVSSVLPVAHWFTDEYVNTGFYKDYSVGFPTIIRIA